MDHHGFAQLLGNYGEFFGAIAVVVTLGYLAVQIRHNTNATKAATSFALNESLADTMGALRSDGELAEIWLKGMQDVGSLTSVEHVRFSAHLLTMLNLAEVYEELERQHLAKAHIDYVPWLAQLYRDNPGIRTYVDSMKDGWAGSRETYEKITNVDLASGASVVFRGEPR